MTVYFARNPIDGLVKIGWTRGDAESRVEEVRKALKLPRLEIIRSIDEWHIAHERRLHNLYKRRRVRGEWFVFHWTMLKVEKISCSVFERKRYRDIEIQMEMYKQRMPAYKRMLP